jgi:hypothetical protein
MNLDVFLEKGSRRMSWSPEGDGERDGRTEKWVKRERPNSDYHTVGGFILDGKVGNSHLLCRSSNLF